MQVYQNFSVIHFFKKHWKNRVRYRFQQQFCPSEAYPNLNKYQFFILNFCILLFQIIVFVIILLGYATGTLTGLIYSIFTSTIFVALIVILEIFIIIWLFWAFTDLVNGRKEFDKQHEISVIIASAFLIPSIFLYLIH